MRRKTIKRGRKTKEETFNLRLEESHKEFERLRYEAEQQELRFRARIESLITFNRKLSSDIDGLNTVIVALGKRISELQSLDDYRSGNNVNLQAVADYEKRR